MILNAGMGTRLRPITPALPKALVPVMNRPLIDYSVELLERMGLTEIAVVVSPGDHATLERARAIAAPGVTVHEAIQDEPRGIGDAAISPGELLDGRNVVVLAADTLLIGDGGRYLEAFAGSGSAAGLVLARVDDPRAFGVAVLEGDRVVDLEEKPAHPRSDLALVGLWLLGPEAVERVRTNPVINAKGESDLTATIGELVSEGSTVLGWQTDGRWLDAGTVDGLLATHAELLARSEAGGFTSTAASAPVARSQLRGPVLIGEGSVIEDSEIWTSVVGAGASVRGARLERCVVLPGAVLEGGSYCDVVITAAGETGGRGALAGAGGRASQARGFES
ncbi:MAG: sugar phosphate nucleotidyltransferase [Dehalococcoidia bacterium]